MEHYEMWCPSVNNIHIFQISQQSWSGFGSACSLPVRAFLYNIELSTIHIFSLICEILWLWLDCFYKMKDPSACKAGGLGAFFFIFFFIPETSGFFLLCLKSGRKGSSGWSRAWKAPCLKGFFISQAKNQQRSRTRAGTFPPTWITVKQHLSSGRGWKRYQHFQSGNLKTS